MVVTAAEYGYVEDLRLLIDAKADIEETATGDGWNSPIVCAARNGHAHAVECLASAKADLNNSRVLLHATKNEQTNVLEVLVAAKVDVDQINGKGETALCIAAARGNINAVKLLLGAKADADKEAEGGYTPVANAIEERHIDILRVLLEARADVTDSRSHHCDGMTYSVSAIEHGCNNEALELLVAAKADIDSTCDSMNESDTDPLLCAIDLGDTDTVRILINANVEVDGDFSDNELPLCRAVDRGKVDVITMLLDAKTDIDYGEPVHALAGGCTPANVRRKVLRLLVNAKADINKQSFSDGQTPAHAAALHAREEMLQLLIEAKADMNMEDHEGLNPTAVLALSKERNEAWRRRHAYLDKKRLVPMKKRKRDRSMPWS